MPEEDPIDELKDKALEEVAEAAEDLVEELVEDLTDGKDNSANPWYKRWWNSWTKGVSVLAIIGGLGTWGLQASIEWYKERKDREYERIERVENELVKTNRELAVLSEQLKASNEARKDNNNERMAMWRALRSNSEEYNEMKVQNRVNAILIDRNREDIKDAHRPQYVYDRHPKESGNDDEESTKLKKPEDVEKLTAFQKWKKKTLGTPKEKEIIEKFEEAQAEQKQIEELLEKSKKPIDKKSLDDFKNEYIQQQQQQDNVNRNNLPPIQRKK
jgi:hypothetical protein